MIQSQSMKGRWCEYVKEPLFCQEGWCENCQVFLDYQEARTEAEADQGIADNTKSYWMHLADRAEG